MNFGAGIMKTAHKLCKIYFKGTEYPHCIRSDDWQARACARALSRSALIKLYHATSMSYWRCTEAISILTCMLHTRLFYGTTALPLLQPPKALCTNLPISLLRLDEPCAVLCTWVEVPSKSLFPTVIFIGYTPPRRVAKRGMKGVTVHIYAYIYAYFCFVFMTKLVITLFLCVGSAIFSDMGGIWGQHFRQRFAPINGGATLRFWVLHHPWYILGYAPDANVVMVRVTQTSSLYRWVNIWAFLLPVNISF